MIAYFLRKPFVEYQNDLSNFVNRALFHNFFNSKYMADFFIRYWNKFLRAMINALWFIINHMIYKDLNIPFFRAETLFAT